MVAGGTGDLVTAAPTSSWIGRIPLLPEQAMEQTLMYPHDTAHRTLWLFLFVYAEEVPAGAAPAVCSAAVIGDLWVWTVRICSPTATR